MSALTAGSLIYSALRRIGVLKAGQSANIETLADGLVALNDLLDAWSIERLTVYTEQAAVYNLVAGQQVYTIGPGGTFNAARPVRISQAGILTPNLSPNGPLRTPLELINRSQWASIPLKAVGSTIPQRLYYDDAFPVGSLSLFPYPSTIVQLELYTWQALASFPDLTTSVSFPPGYARALRLNLAMELAPEFQGKAMNVRELALVQAQADEAKGRIKAQNMPVEYMSCDPAYTRSSMGGRFNWLTGE